MTTVKLTQTQINEAINALEEASRVLNNINIKDESIALVSEDFSLTFIKLKDISNLKEEVRSAWATLSKAQHEQTFAV